MQKFAIAALAAPAALWTAPAAAAAISAEAAIGRYCEPLVAGASVGQIEALARKDGLEADRIEGQRVMRRGDLIVVLSESPRFCFVLAPPAMTRAEGFAFVDAWVKSQSGAESLAVTVGPEGEPVQMWAVPARRIGFIATVQRNPLSPSGPKVMSFILMPLPSAPAAR